MPPTNLFKKKMTFAIFSSRKVHQAYNPEIIFLSIIKGHNYR